jgi:hypothetical protein
MKNWIKLGAVLGVAYCVAGFVLIFLGWNGAASEDREAAQLPYVISGGIAGLALVVVGGSLMVAHSLRTDRVELRAAIDDLRAAIERRDAVAPAVGAAAPSGVATTVVAGADSYHRPGCRLVEGQDGTTTMSREEARAGGRTACRVCAPDTA